MKRPAFQFYPADWRKDPALSICSLAARGLWIELMCIMHEADEYGTLTVNGKGMTLQQIARMVGESPAALKKLLDELEDAGVFSRADDGSIYSRRMIRDENLRSVRAAGGEAGKSFGQLGAEHGKKGGRPRKETGVKKPPLEPPPSSSSSSSSKNRGDQAATTGLDPAAAASPPPDPIQSRALELVAMLRQRGAAISAGNPHVNHWAEIGVTDAQALSALETAEQRRSDTGSVQPVNAGLLNAIIDDALNPQRSRPAGRRSIHDERTETIAALTGRRNHEQHESGNVIDITPTAAAGGMD